MGYSLMSYVCSGVVLGVFARWQSLNTINGLNTGHHLLGPPIRCIWRHRPHGGAVMDAGLRVELPPDHLLDIERAEKILNRNKWTVDSARFSPRRNFADPIHGAESYNLGWRGCRQCTLALIRRNGGVVRVGKKRNPQPTLKYQ